MLTREILDETPRRPCASRRFLIAFSAFVLVLAVGLEARRESSLQTRSDRFEHVCTNLRAKLCDAWNALGTQETRESSLVVPFALSDEIHACTEGPELFDFVVYRQAVMYGDFTTAAWQMERAVTQLIGPTTTYVCLPTDWHGGGWTSRDRDRRPSAPTRMRHMSIWHDADRRVV